MYRYIWMLLFLFLGCESPVDNIDENIGTETSYITFPKMNHSTTGSLTNDDTLILQYEYNISSHNYNTDAQFSIRYTIRRDENSTRYVGEKKLNTADGSIIDTLVFSDEHIDLDSIYRPIIFGIAIVQKLEDMIVGLKIAHTTVVFE